MISFNASNAKKTVLTALVLTGVVTIVRDVAAHEMPDVPKLLLGTIIAAILLTLLAEAIPELAASLSILVLVATLLQSGAPVVKAATLRLGTPKPPKGSVTA